VERRHGVLAVRSRPCSPAREAASRSS
jgi:hypothetical protein